MRTLFLAAVFALTMPAALADDDVMAGFYGNTAIATGGLADTYSHFSPDHTFDLKVPAYGLTFGGTWKIDGGNMILILRKLKRQSRRTRACCRGFRSTRWL